MRTVYLGADHRGFELKNQLSNWLEQQGHQVVDCGNTAYEPGDDYPDFAVSVAQQVAENEGSIGVVLCGSGVGATIAANKVAGVRATEAWRVDQVAHARTADNVNVIGIGADYHSFEGAKSFVETLLHTPFEGADRQVRRLKKISQMEASEN